MEEGERVRGGVEGERERVEERGGEGERGRGEGGERERMEKGGRGRERGRGGGGER